MKKLLLLLLIPISSFSQSVITIDTGLTSFRFNGNIYPKNSLIMNISLDTNYVQFITLEREVVTKQTRFSRVVLQGDTATSTSQIRTFFQSHCTVNGSVLFGTLSEVLSTGNDAGNNQIILDDDLGVSFDVNDWLWNDSVFYYDVFKAYSTGEVIIGNNNVNSGILTLRGNEITSYSDFNNPMIIYSPDGLIISYVPFTGAVNDTLATLDVNGMVSRVFVRDIPSFPYTLNVTASGNGSATSFAITIPSGYTKSIVQSRNSSIAVVSSSSISGTTLTVTTSNTPASGTNNILLTATLTR